MALPKYFAIELRTFEESKEEILMSNSTTKQNFEQALVSMARSLSTEEWQAMAAMKGVKFPYTLSEKVKILRKMINTVPPRTGA